MSKKNPYSKGNTNIPNIFVKVTPESTLTKYNADISINNPNVNIVTPPKPIQTDVFSIIEYFDYITISNVQYIEYLRHKENINEDLNKFLKNFNNIYDKNNENNNEINFDGNIFDTFLLIIIHSSPLDFQLIRNVLFMSYYINLYKLKEFNEIIDVILNYFKGNLIFLILQNFNDKRLTSYLQTNVKMVIDVIIYIYRIDNNDFLFLLKNNVKNTNDTNFQVINDLIMTNVNIKQNFTNLKDKMTNFFCEYVKNDNYDFDIKNENYLRNFLEDENITNFCSEKNKKYKLFNIINDTVIYHILPNDTKSQKQTIGNDYRYVDLFEINNKILEKICEKTDTKNNKKLFYHYFLEIIVNHLFFDYFNDLKILNHSIKDDNLLLLFYENLNKFFEWVVDTDDKKCFNNIKLIIDNKTQKRGGKYQNKNKKKTSKNKTKKGGKQKRWQTKKKKHKN